MSKKQTKPFVGNLKILNPVMACRARTFKVLPDGRVEYGPVSKIGSVKIINAKEQYQTFAANVRNSGDTAAEVMRGLSSAFIKTSKFLLNYIKTEETMKRVIKECEREGKIRYMRIPKICRKNSRQPR